MYIDCPGSNGCQQGVQLQQWDQGTNDTWSYDANAQALKSNNLCLDVKSSGTANGTAVQTWGCNNTNAQKWQWVWDTVGWQLKNANSGKCLDASGSRGNGTKLQIWDCQDKTTVSQHWAPV
jgi:hypothetical protein